MQALPVEGFQPPQDGDLRDRIVDAAPDLAVLLGGQRKTAQEILSEATRAEGAAVHEQMESQHPSPRGRYNAFGEFETPEPPPLQEPPASAPQEQQTAPPPPPTPQQPQPVGPTTEQLLMQQNQQLIALLASQQAAQQAPVVDPTVEFHKRAAQVAEKWQVDTQDVVDLMAPIVEPLAQQTAQVQATIRAMQARETVAQQYPEAIEKASEIAAYIQQNPALDQQINSLWQNGNEQFALQTAYFAWKAANPMVAAQVAAQAEQQRTAEASQAAIVGRGQERQQLPPAQGNTRSPEEMATIREAYRMGYPNPLAREFLSRLAPHEQALLGMQSR